LLYYDPIPTFCFFQQVRFGLRSLIPLSTKFPLYHGGQFYWWRKPPTCRKSVTNIIYTSPWTVFELTILMVTRPNKKICVFTVTCQKNLGSVGRHYFYYYFIFFIGKIRNPTFHFRNFGKPSFVEAVLWRVTQFFYLLCSQFRQKASGWINKTLLLIKQQKWLSEFCVKIDRVASKN
jgi:hypothetical protein